ncbi:uncharacterized protein LKV04_001021 [Tautogolabrus adspersus]
MKILYVIMFYCFSASTVSPGSSPSITTMLTESESLPQGRFPSSTEPSPAASTVSATEADRPEATKLKDTTVVIIVSVSLALLVCAVIPVIFYGNCRTNREEKNRTEASKSEADYFEENASVTSTHGAVRLQSLDPESGAQDASHYAAIYKALDPTSLD